VIDIPAGATSDAMVGRKRRKTKKLRLMGSHQRCWIWGRHVVFETLRAGRWPILELRIDDGLEGDERHALTRLAAERGFPLISETSARLAQLCGASDHQGVLAKMPPFPYATLDAVLLSRGIVKGDMTGGRVSSAADGPASTALVMLDRVQDPHNFGAIIRAADVLGMDGLIVGTESQSAVTSVVARSSAGAVNYLPVAQAPDLVSAVHELRRVGFVAVAADADAHTTLDRQDLTAPTVLVLGNENTGVSEQLRAACNATVRIPQAGHVASLNVAVAAGILFYELQRQRAQLPHSSSV
jgi:23S rRNA (guanosine2251-2'-O)-methyltransferase